MPSLVVCIELFICIYSWKYIFEILHYWLLTYVRFEFMSKSEKLLSRNVTFLDFRDLFGVVLIQLL